MQEFNWRFRASVKTSSIYRMHTNPRQSKRPEPRTREDKQEGEEGEEEETEKVSYFYLQRPESTLHPQTTQ